MRKLLQFAAQRMEAQEMTLWLIVILPVWLPLAAFVGIHTADAWIGGRAWKGDL